MTHLGTVVAAQPLHFLFPSELALTIAPITDPVQVFLIIVAIMLVAPLVFERLRMPGIIGLILAGVVVGPHGVHILERDETIELLGTVGLLFLMFLGGLETSLNDLKGNAGKALTFGLATFLVPMGLGTLVMQAIGYDLLAAILVASCFASHTLIALPILTRLGIMRSPAVTMTLGATLITNILALLVLAVVVKADSGTLTLSFWLFLIPALALYTVLTLVGVPLIGRWFFKQFGHDEGAEFVFVLATLFVVSAIADWIQIEPIVGAFLAGIALTPLIPQLSPLMNRLQFIGNTLFVPFFLISVGMLVDPQVLVNDPRSIAISLTMVGGVLVSKFVAAWAAAAVFRLPFSNTMLLFGLSIAQAASTLAAVTVAFDIDLVDELTVNGTIAMILVTCILSPWITAQWGRKIKPEAPSSTKPLGDQIWGDRILVPVANPNTENNLLQLGLILAKRSSGTLLPTHVIADAGNPVSTSGLARQRQLLDAAEQFAHGAVTSVESVGRVDESIDKGVIRVAAERNVSLIICGWKGFSTAKENFFGGILDNIVRMSSVPVLISRFPEPIQNTNRVVLAVEENEATPIEFKRSVELAKILADELKAALDILQIRSQSQSRYETLEGADIAPSVPRRLLRGQFANQVVQNVMAGDLLLLPATTHLIGQPVLGRAAEAIARRRPGTSMIIIHFPRQS